MDDVLRLMSTGDTVKIWDADLMTPLEQFNPHSSSHPVAQACWTANNQHAVSASSSGDKVAVTSLKSPGVPSLELGQGKVQTRVCLSSSSQLAASGGLDRCVHIWDLKTARLLRSLKDHGEEVTCVSFNANDSLLASGSAGGRLHLYGLATNASGKPFGHGQQQPVRDLGLSCLRRSLLGSVSDGGWLTLWDANTQKELHAFRGAHKAPGSALAFSPASELLVLSVGLDKKIVCYDTASKIALRCIRAESPLTSVAFTPDGSGVLVGSAQGEILRYDLRNSAAPVRVTPAHATSVTCLRFQCAAARHKSGKTSSSRASGSKGSISKLSSPAPSSCPHINAAGGGAEMAHGDAGGQPRAEHDKLGGMGRSSLDMFSPLRQDAGSPPAGGQETPQAVFPPSREAGVPQLSGRGSLDMFSPLREEHVPGADPTPRKASAGRLLRQAPAHQTPSILEEEPTPDREPAKAEPEEEGQAPPGAGPSAKPFAPEPSARRANGVQAQLDYDSPAPAASSAGAPAAASEGAPFSSAQINVITDIIDRKLDELRDACHRDIVNLQVEMIRQFFIQLNELNALMSAHQSANEALLQENQRLREENLRLKTNY